MNLELEKYRQKLSFANKYLLKGKFAKFAAAVVVPSYAEGKYLIETVESLIRNTGTFLDRTAIIFIVNHPRDLQKSILPDNKESISYLKKLQNRFKNFFLVSDKDGMEDLTLDNGVGEARKIGMDLALEIVEEKDSFIASLDADTLVNKNYLTVLFNFFEKKNADAAVIAFSHRNDENTPEIIDAIKLYERYLKNYVNGLKDAGSPYAFHSIGSAMAFTARAYIRAGGMKIRKGGEDFYFLQSLVKTGKVGEINEVLVYPSNRLSERVPFGTGPALKKILSGNRKIFHNPLVFKELKMVLSSAMEFCENRNK
ncbi:MAG TPA: glycosyltransferase, partial [Victivallales bacterium]|nr:glycosyltransferase [Victivallales bacterium]